MALTGLLNSAMEHAAAPALGVGEAVNYTSPGGVVTSGVNVIVNRDPMTYVFNMGDEYVRSYEIHVDASLIASIEIRGVFRIAGEDWFVVVAPQTENSQHIVQVGNTRRKAFETSQKRRR